MHKFLFLIVGVSFLGCSSPKEENVGEIQKEIGRYLFYDKRLSLNESKSCASCHNPEFAFTDGYKRSFGAFADLHRHNTLPLFNLNYLTTYSLTDSSITTLERQMKEPFFGKSPIEMGMDSSDTRPIENLFKEEPYKRLFNKLSPSKKHKDWPFIIESIASFIKTLESKNSRYDQYISGRKEALDTEELQGMKLFFSQEVGCTNCHGGLNFSSPVSRISSYIRYFPENKNKYRIPTLRNMTFTAPYFHDGSATSLTEVLRFYQKDSFIKSLYNHNLPKDRLPTKRLTDNDVYNLVKFLKTLDDPEIKTNPDYRNPFNF